jgi:N-acetylneuraminic acid mutarotase
VAASDASSALLIGGLDQSDQSSTQIVRLESSGARRIASLPVALHDATASALGGSVFLFGGGSLESFSGITRVSPGGQAQPAGRLPTPASDVASAQIGGTIYIVGGYTGQAPLRTILAWRPRQTPRVAGMLPQPVRYAAVATQRGGLVIAGGTTGTTAGRDVYRFDPANGRVALLARLPRPLTHAAAVSLGATVLVLGGRGADLSTQTRQILAISPSGAVSIAGELPRALSDLAAVALGQEALLAGGRDAGGQVRAEILRVSVR